MRKLFACFIVVFLLSSTVYADEPATSYYIIKSESLKKLIPNGSDVSDISRNVLTEASDSQGYFVGPCKVVLKKDKFQIHINTTFENDILSYFFGIREKSERDINVSGTVKLSNNLTTGTGWEKSDFAVLFHNTNLKR